MLSVTGLFSANTDKMIPPVNADAARFAAQSKLSVPTRLGALPMDTVHFGNSTETVSPLLDKIGKIANHGSVYREPLDRLWQEALSGNLKGVTYDQLRETNSLREALHADNVSPDGVTVLRNTLEALITKNGMDPLAPGLYNKNALFHDVIITKYFPLFETVLKHVHTTQQLNTLNFSGDLPIRRAIANLNEYSVMNPSSVQYKIVEALVNHPAFDAFAENPKGETAVDMAIQKGARDLTRKILGKQGIVLDDMSFGKLWPFLQMTAELPPSERRIVKVWLHAQQEGAKVNFADLAPLMERALKATLAKLNK